MRDYQNKRNEKYILPHTVYHLTLWRIRDYYRLKEYVKDIANTATAIRYDKDKVQSSPTADMVHNAAVKVSDTEDIIRAIDHAKTEIPTEYRAGVWNSIHFGTAFPEDAARSTYALYKSRFIYSVADKLGYI